jgi:calcium-dependent protein kinase
MMKKIDANQSETIDYTEFIAAAIDKKNLLSDERIKTCFNMFDKDRSGKISLLEFKETFGVTEIVDDAVWDELIKQADQNNDGEIEFTEFRDLLLKMIA